MTAADPGTLTWLRDRNDRAALRLLLEHGPLSRAQLAELSGMSKPSAAKMLARLEQAGLAVIVGESPGARGPNAMLHGVRPTAMTGVAINVLPDVIEAVAVDPVGTVHPVVTIPVADGPRTPERDVEDAVAAACAAAGLDAGEVSLVVIGVQAAVNPNADEVAFTNTLPGWPLAGARARIELATGRTVILDNDVTLAALAERASGAVDHAPSFVYLWLGDGLGAGLDVDGVVQRGSTGGAGEIGYLEVPRSAAALDAAARDFTDLLGRHGIVGLLGAGAGASLAEVLPETLAGHPALDALAARVALLVAPIVALNDPGLVVLGGPTGTAGGAALAERVEARLQADDAARLHAPRSLPRTRVVTASVTDRPVLTGARQLLVSHIWNRLDEAVSSGNPEAVPATAALLGRTQG